MVPSGEQVFELTVVGAAAAIVFFAAYTLPQRVTATFLILLIPFQAVVTQYATANVVLTWVVFISMIMRRDQIRLPMLPQMLIVLFVCLVSTSLQHPSTYVQQGIYIVNLVTAYLVLCIAYDLSLRLESIEKIVNVFVWLNVLVAIYCTIQVLSGPNHTLGIPGISDLRMEPVREDYRITGPFGTAGITAEYFAISIYLAIYKILITDKKAHRHLLSALIAVNFVLMFESGARGGLLAFGGAGLLFLLLFKREIGAKRTLQIVVAGVAVFVVAAGITVTYSQHGQIFERLADTEVDEGIPDTRQKAWPNAWKEIKIYPILGHGPRLKLADEETDTTYRYHKHIQYPHDLYLFFLFTTGSVGLVVFMIFLLTPLYVCWKTSRLPRLPAKERAFAKIGVVVMVVFFVDQIKIEFLRISYTDYWHYLFAIFGAFMAVCDRAKANLGANGKLDSIESVQSTQ